jgi:hypothetical protein
VDETWKFAMHGAPVPVDVVGPLVGGGVGAYDVAEGAKVGVAERSGKRGIGVGDGTATGAGGDNVGSWRVSVGARALSPCPSGVTGCTASVALDTVADGVGPDAAMSRCFGKRATSAATTTSTTMAIPAITATATRPSDTLVRRCRAVTGGGASLEGGPMEPSKDPPPTDRRLRRSSRSVRGRRHNARNELDSRSPCALLDPGRSPGRADTLIEAYASD